VLGGGGKRQLGRPRCRWKDNIKVAVQEVGWERMDWIALAQDRNKGLALVNAVMSLQVVKKAGNFLTS